jgi:hypothetical protein
MKFKNLLLVLVAGLVGLSFSGCVRNIKTGLAVDQNAENTRFTDNGDGTVTDNTTRLMWTKNANHGHMNWKEAVAYCSNLVYAGYDDWRLPSVNEHGGRAELDTLGWSGGVPDTGPFTAPGAPFNGVQSDYYWSGTSFAHFSDGAWAVFMRYGSVYSYYKASKFYVWPVRGGQ